MGFTRLQQSQPRPSIQRATRSSPNKIKTAPATRMSHLKLSSIDAPSTVNQETYRSADTLTDREKGLASSSPLTLSLCSYEAPDRPIRLRWRFASFGPAIAVDI